LDAELECNISKINNALDLTQFGPFIAAARDALGRGSGTAGHGIASVDGSRSMQPTAAFLLAFINTCIQEGLLATGMRVPTDFQLRLILASGVLGDPMTISSVVAEPGADVTFPGAGVSCALPLALKIEDCMITAMLPDEMLMKRVIKNGLGNSVKDVRMWLRGALCDCMVDCGCADDSRGLDSIFSPAVVEGDAAEMLQAFVRRLIQRHIIRYAEVLIPAAVDSAFSFKYSIMEDGLTFAPGGPASLPPTYYWLPFDDLSQECPSSVSEVSDDVEGIPSLRHRRVLSMQHLVELRGVFLRRFEDLLKLYYAQRQRLQQVELEESGG
jgi:hypothetical protein